MKTKQLILSIFMVFISLCEATAQGDMDSTYRETLTRLEYKWLKAEFALDTAYLSGLMDDAFMAIGSTGIHNKQQSLDDMYETISRRMRDSILIDSFELRNMMIQLHGEAAVVTFVVHTWGKNKGQLRERDTRFYDVWVRRHGLWKAVASQGTPL